METFRKKWRRTPRPIRQTVVLVVGIVVMAAGVIMLAIPGPGWLTIFVGLAIIATEFEVADRLKKRVETRVKDTAKQAANKAKRLRKK